MKSTLYLKFIIIYLILGFLSIFTIATLSSQLIKDSLIKNSGKALYTEATSFSSKYLSSYFVEQISKEDLNLQLSGLSASMHASAWFVDKNGNFIEYVSVFGQQAPESIPDFDPAEALMVGDSLTSDIRGARNAGLRSCWYNPHDLPPRPDIVPDYTIHALAELPPLLERI